MVRRCHGVEAGLVGEEAEAEEVVMAGKNGVEGGEVGGFERRRCR